MMSARGIQYLLKTPVFSFNKMDAANSSYLIPYDIA